jgi:aspartyl protease family protein
MDGETMARVGYLAIILVALGGWVLVEFRQRMGQALRMGLAWGLIFVGVMAGYGLWSDIRRDVMPIQEVAQDGAVEVPRSADGHYYLTLMINGTGVGFMVDTGASGMVLAATRRAWSSAARPTRRTG